MLKPGDLIRSTTEFALANVRYDARPTRAWNASYHATDVRKGELAMVVGSLTTTRDDDRPCNEIYVLLLDGRHGWTFKELWGRPGALWVKLRRAWGRLGR